VEPVPWQVVDAHVPSRQVSPSQQSASEAQLAAASPQAQIPLSQVSRLQQSRSRLQALPRSEQMQRPPAQCRPAQHSSSLAQVTCLPAHGTQLSFWQRKPAQQMGPAAASLQASPCSPQTGTHVLPWHSKPAQQSCSTLQVAPSTPQPRRQTPLSAAVPEKEQLRLVQQSPLRSQLSPSSLQRGTAQRPSSQPPEQHSVASSQPAPSARQP
jgi:hypothetical protein